MKVNSNSSDAGTLDIVGRSVSAQYASYAFLILATWTVYQAIFRKKTNAPPGNPPTTSIQWLFSIVQRVRFLDQGRNLMHNAWKKYPHRCFKMVTELGELVILPNEYADVIRGDERLNSEEFFEDVFTSPGNNMSGGAWKAKTLQLFPDNIPELKILRPNPGLFLPLIQTHLIRHLGSYPCSPFLFFFSFNNILPLQSPLSDAITH